MTSIQTVFLIQWNLEIKASGNIEHWSVFIGILLQSTAWYAGVKQHQPQFVLGWMTIIVCQFLLIILRIGPKTKVPWRCDSMNLSLGLSANFNF